MCETCFIHIKKETRGYDGKHKRNSKKRAGIGIATVSRYFNDSGYVSEESREKIRKAVEELDYTLTHWLELYSKRILKS